MGLVKTLNTLNENNTSFQENIDISHVPGVLARTLNNFRCCSSKQLISVDRNPYYQEIKSRIDSKIEERQLYNFYPKNSFQYINLLNIVTSVDFQAIAMQRHISLEYALDLVYMSLFDVVLFVDDGLSMSKDEELRDSDEKKDDLKLIMSRIVDIVAQFNDDGISIRYFNNDEVYEGIRNEQYTAKTVDDNICAKQHDGNIGDKFVSKVFNPYVFNKAQSAELTKPVLIYVVTDRAPYDKEYLRNIILTCKVQLNNEMPILYDIPTVFPLMFIEVGSGDMSFHSFFKADIDIDVDIGDDVNAIRSYDSEFKWYADNNVYLHPDHYIHQLMLGAICKEYEPKWMSDTNTNEIRYPFSIRHTQTS